MLSLALVKKKIANNYITKSNATYITKLTFKETTKALTVEQIKASFQNKATKQEIIKDFNLKNTEKLSFKNKQSERFGHYK